MASHSSRDDLDARTSKAEALNETSQKEVSQRSPKKIAAIADPRLQKLANLRAATVGSKTVSLDAKLTAPAAGTALAYFFTSASEIIEQRLQRMGVEGAVAFLSETSRTFDHYHRLLPTASDLVIMPSRRREHAVRVFTLQSTVPKKLVDAINTNYLCEDVASDVSSNISRLGIAARRVGENWPSFVGHYCVDVGADSYLNIRILIGQSIVASLFDYLYGGTVEADSVKGHVDLFDKLPFLDVESQKLLDIFEAHVSSFRKWQRGGGIPDAPSSEGLSKTATAEELAQLVKYARNNPSKTVSECVRDVMGLEASKVSGTNTQKIKLPEKAPVLWEDRNDKKNPKLNGLNPVEFVKRVYARWLNDGGELPRAHIKKLDEPLYIALATHISRHGKPTDIRIPAHKAAIDELEAPPTEADIARMRRIVRAHETRGAANRGKNTK